MKLGKYIIKNVTKDFDNQSYDWISILPNIEVRHKYWYLYEIQFSWFNLYLRIEICNINWNKRI